METEFNQDQLFNQSRLCKKSPVKSLHTDVQGITHPDSTGRRRGSSARGILTSCPTCLFHLVGSDPYPL